MSFLVSIRERHVCLSVLTLGELRKGAETRRRTDVRAADSLDEWIAEIAEVYADRLLVVDEAVADVWGRLSAIRPRPVVDTLIAATALAHGMTLVTRNVADMNDTGVALINPWAPTREQE
ncbi:type II toxin-antitoxin system VapC family toxin [Kaistia sp. 32K]|uniref:type II toxin-antitoxin system VapC family toxin n=1 Tax=Kaistia sp. 32K TaxID=2795690 RepID=UPI001FD28F9B|nr:type II toxin-antitoxin system VapC family toxin [Kaistia sp. 32K]